MNKLSLLKKITFFYKKIRLYKILCQKWEEVDHNWSRLWKGLIRPALVHPYTIKRFEIRNSGKNVYIDFNLKEWNIDSIKEGTWFPNWSSDAICYSCYFTFLYVLVSFRTVSYSNLVVNFFTYRASFCFLPIISLINVWKLRFFSCHIKIFNVSAIFYFTCKLG